MARFEDDGKGIDVWLIVTLLNLDLDLESRLDVMLHRFLFSQAESPKGSKTQAHSSPLECKMSNCSPVKKVGNLYSKVWDMIDILSST